MTAILHFLAPLLSPRGIGVAVIIALLVMAFTYAIIRASNHHAAFWRPGELVEWKEDE